MHVVFSSAFAVIGLIEFMLGGVAQNSILSRKLSITLQKRRVMHGPLLYRSLLFEVMFGAISGSSFRIEVVAVRVQIVPSSQICSFDEISFMEGAASAVGGMRHA